ncbi:MAG: BNR repeat-containing protein [Treponema sp.]|jgi:hypothetical protein|nr:BNR repeat-containing protein [Treponema sp.]
MFCLVLLALSALDSFSSGNSGAAGNGSNGGTELAATVNLVEVGKGYSKNSINTVVFRKNSLVTHNDTQYIAYYDGDGYVTLGKRTLGTKDWTIQKTRHTGNVLDAHNSISIMADGAGYLHVAWDHHGHPLSYAKSDTPGSLILGDKEAMTGQSEGNVTYPEFYRLANGNLLFAYRDGTSGSGNLAINSYETTTKIWTKVTSNLISGESQRNPYWQLYMDKAGTLHCSWVWRESSNVSTNNNLCYARSKNGGLSWERSDGTAYAIPITKATAEIAWEIPQNSDLINQTSIYADDAGNPYIATYFTTEAIPQYQLIWKAGAHWVLNQVSRRTEDFSLSGGGTLRIPIARPQLVVKQTGDKLSCYYIMRDEEYGSKVRIACLPDMTAPYWTYHDITDFSVDAWEPSYDTELWKNQGKLHIFVQNTEQVSGEGMGTREPQTVYVLEVDFVDRF